MKILLILFATMTFTLSAHAQDAFYVSGLLGLTNVDTENDTVTLDTELSYGLRVGVLFNDHVSAGLYINHYGTSNSGVDVGLTNIMAEASYYFNEADENTFWVSGLLGISNEKVESSSQKLSDSETSYGVSGGYQFMLAPNFSLSPQVTYIRIAGDSEYSEFSGMANLTAWF